MSRTLLLISLAASAPQMLLSQEAEEEDYDLASRGPYEYKFRVDDPETYNKYEIEEKGDPDIVKGSYRINLPDGRTQVVNYEVHPERGYEAKITYEGEAQYPDTPGYVATPYGPPEPLRPGFEKFKRDSKAAASLLTESDDDSKIAKKRDARKVEIKFSNNGPIKNLRPKAEDLIAAQTKIDVEQIEKKDVVIEKETKTTGGKKYDPKKQKIVVVVDENLPTKNAVDEENNGDDDFYDSEHSPQAEPLSLRQNTKPRNKTNKKKETVSRRAEYRPEELISKQEPTIQAISTAGSKIQEDENVFVPLIYEAVPTLRQEDDLHLDLAKENVKTAENILDDIYTESDPDSSNPTVVLDLLDSAFDPDLPVLEFREVTPRAGPGIQIAEQIPETRLPAPGPAESNRVKNHRKRKIDIKDFNKNPVDPNPYLYLLKQEYPTLYRSQTDLAPAGAAAAGYQLPAANIPDRSKNVPNINAEDYEHLYQTIFGEADLVQTPQKVLRKVRVPKQLASPHFLSPLVHHPERLRLVQTGSHEA